MPWRRSPWRWPWPDDKREELLVARDAFLEAEADWFYSIDLKQTDIDDSVRELSEAVEKTELVRRVAIGC